MISPLEITLRPATAADQDLLLRIYAGSREAELAMTPWNQQQKDAFIAMQFQAQTKHYEATYPGASHDLICRGAQPVGRLYLARQRDEFHILDIAVLPPERKTGVGSHVLRSIQDEARRAGKPVTIYVESFNPSLRLLEHLGFKPVRMDGFQYLLQSS